MRAKTPTLQRVDGNELRRRILGLSQSEAQRFGIGKSTLHYLRKRTACAYLRIYGPVQERLETEVLEKK
ncbi:MAG: hypothetical protein WCC94_08615 [Candidatus Bathyarchaeia archaeon]